MSPYFYTYLGGSSWDGGVGITVDASENVFVTGWTWSTDFPTTVNAYQTNGASAFVVKIGEQPLPSTPSQSQGQGSGANNQGTSNAPGLENAPGVQTAPGLKK